MGVGVEMVCCLLLGCHIQERSTLGRAATGLSLTPSTWFECVSMLVILLNCVTLGMYQPCDDMECLSDRCKILQVSLSVVPSSLSWVSPSKLRAPL